MKTKLLSLLVILLTASIIYAATSSYGSRKRKDTNDYSVIKCLTISETDGDVNDFTVTLSNLAYTTLERITIDANGTDTDFDVYLYDSYTYDAITIFSKTDCSTAAAMQYAISMSDTGSTEFVGVPVGAAPTLVLADGDDATMTGLIIKIYYREEYQP